MKSGKVRSLYDQVREAIHNRWDPIGVAQYSNEMGEYDSYVPALCELLEKKVDQRQIFNYLWIVETESIGMNGNRKATEEFSAWLYQLVNSENE